MTGQWVCGERHVDVHVRVLIRCLGRADRLHIPQTIAPSHRVQVFQGACAQVSRIFGTICQGMCRQSQHAWATLKGCCVAATAGL